MALSPEQVKQFQEDGYLVLPSWSSKEVRSSTLCTIAFAGGHERACNLQMSACFTVISQRRTAQGSRSALQ